MTELFGRLAPGADLEAARAELRARPRRDASRSIPRRTRRSRFPHRRGAAARSDHLAGADGAARAARGVGAGLRHRVLERREPDPGAIGAARRRARDPRGARRQRRRAAADAARREPAAVRRRRAPRRARSRGRWSRSWRGMRRASRCARSTSRSMRACSGSASSLALAAAVLLAFVPRLPSADASNGFGLSNGSAADHVGHEPPPAPVRRHADCRVVRAARRRRHAADDAARAAGDARPGFDTRSVLALNVPVMSYGAHAASRSPAFYREVMRRITRAARRASRSPSAPSCRGATPAAFGPGFQFSAEGYAKAERRRRSARAVPHGLAGLLRRARRAAHRRPRLHRRRPPRRRDGRHRQPEPGAADVPRPGRA